MFKTNATRLWMEQKDPKKRSELVKKAVQEGKEIRRQDREFTQKYRRDVRQRVRDKQRKLSEKEEIISKHQSLPFINTNPFKEYPNKIKTLKLLYMKTNEKTCVGEEGELFIHYIYLFIIVNMP